MNSYDVVGYANTEDGYCLCLKCAKGQEDKLSAIFADSEWDYYPSCDTCGDIITDVRLTTFGQEQYGFKKNPIEG